MPLALAIAAAVVVAALALTAAYFAYRHWYFGRDPQRTIHPTARLVAPADGQVIYVRDVADGMVPITIKQRREIPLTDIVKGYDQPVGGVLIGIYLSPFDVHYQRSPIAGVVRAVTYHSAPRNEVMESMFWRHYLRMQPMYVNSPHIYLNERNIIHIAGERDEVYVVQIADYYVNRIDCYVQPGDVVAAGQKIGMIHAGSQVDLFVLRAQAHEMTGAQVGKAVQAGATALAL